jgi:hypothetical protein
MAQKMAQAEEALRGRRPRREHQSDPKILERNAEIYKLRNEDPKTWSWKRLTGRFGLKTLSATRAAYNAHRDLLNGIRPRDRKRRS